MPGRRLETRPPARALPTLGIVHARLSLFTTGVFVSFCSGKNIREHETSCQVKLSGAKFPTFHRAPTRHHQFPHSRHPGIPLLLPSRDQQPPADPGGIAPAALTAAALWSPASSSRCRALDLSTKPRQPPLRFSLLISPWDELAPSLDTYH
ncbi:hypothetical protein F4802DRAFT_544029 [Xylaria palmicola]|nr:hypothetical protein F4802DRAFT_544029 [Xylaria palmicola]